MASNANKLNVMLRILKLFVFVAEKWVTWVAIAIAVILCSECGKHNHQMLHYHFRKTSVQRINRLLPRDGILLMVISVYNMKYPVTTLWNPGSNISLITHRITKKLGLKDRNISIYYESRQ